MNKQQKDFLCLLIEMFLMALTMLLITLVVEILFNQVHPGLISISQLFYNILSPIFTIASIVLLYKTLQEQKEQNVRLHDEFEQKSLTSSLNYELSNWSVLFESIEELSLSDKGANIVTKLSKGRAIYSDIITEAKLFFEFLGTEKYIKYDEAVVEYWYHMNDECEKESQDPFGKPQYSRYEIEKELRKLFLSEKLNINETDFNYFKEFETSEERLRFIFNKIYLRHNKSVCTLILHLFYNLSNIDDFVCSANKHNKKQKKSLAENLVKRIRLYLTDDEKVVIFIACSKDMRLKELVTKYNVLKSLANKKIFEQEYNELLKLMINETL